jgi:hypothetical protein
MMRLTEKSQGASHVPGNTPPRHAATNISTGFVSGSRAGILPIQRKAACACGGDCPRCAQSQGQDASSIEKRSSPIQRRTTGRVAEDKEGLPEVEKTLAQPGRPLEPDLLHNMESRFGHSFANVRVHTDSAAARSARALNAHAYTVGQHVVFDSGEYRPQTGPGMHLLAHELTHVVQQGGASFRPERAIQLSSGSSHLEREADRAANQVLTGQRPTVHGSSDTSPVQRLLRAEHGTYVSTVSTADNKAYLEAGAQFYRTWGHPNVTTVANMQDILNDLDKAKDPIDKFRIVSHGSPGGLDLGLLPEVGSKDFFNEESTQFTTQARFRKEFTDQRIVEESFFDRIYGALWKNSGTQALLITMGAGKDAPAEGSNLGIFLRAVIDNRFLADVQLDTGGHATITNSGALQSFINLRRSKYGALVVSDAAKDKQADVKKALASLPGLVPGVMTAATLSFGALTADEAKTLADPFVEKGALKKSLSKSVEEGAGGPYLKKLKSVKGKINNKTHIEIRGCNVGRSAETMDALRGYFGSPGALPSMSAPDLYQYFFQLGVQSYGSGEQADLEAAFGNSDFGLQQGYENITRLKAGEMTRVVSETKLSELAAKYGFNTDKVRKLNPQIADPDDLHMGDTVWLLPRLVVPAGIYTKLGDFCRDYLGDILLWPKVWAVNSWIMDPSALKPDDKITVPKDLLTPPIVSPDPTAKDFASAVRGGKAVAGLASKDSKGRDFDPSRPVVRVDDSQRAKALGDWLAAQKFDPKGRTADVLSKRFGKSGKEFETGRKGTYVQFLSVRYPNAEDPIFPDDPRYDKHIINRP